MSYSFLPHFAFTKQFWIWPFNCSSGPHVNRSSFMDGLRAIPTTKAAKSWPMPCKKSVPLQVVASSAPLTLLNKGLLCFSLQSEDLINVLKQKETKTWKFGFHQQINNKWRQLCFLFHSWGQPHLGATSHSHHGNGTAQHWHTSMSLGEGLTFVLRNFMVSQGCGRKKSEIPGNSVGELFWGWWKRDPLKG